MTPIVDVVTEIKKETLDKYLKTIEQTLLELDGYVDFSCQKRHIRQHVNAKNGKLLKITDNFRQSILYKGEKLPLEFEDTTHQLLLLKVSLRKKKRVHRDIKYSNKIFTLVYLCYVEFSKIQN